MKNKTFYDKNLTDEEAAYIANNLVNAYFGEKIKITDQQCKMKAIALKNLAAKENKTFEDLKKEFELSKFLDERGLCFTDL